MDWPVGGSVAPVRLPAVARQPVRLTRACAWAEWLAEESRGPMPRYHGGFVYADAESEPHAGSPWDAVSPERQWLEDCAVAILLSRVRVAEICEALPGWTEHVYASRLDGRSKWGREEVRRLCRLIRWKIPGWALDGRQPDC